jgi:hypothetical protein
MGSSKAAKGALSGILPTSCASADLVSGGVRDQLTGGDPGPPCRILDPGIPPIQEIPNAQQTHRTGSVAVEGQSNSKASTRLKSCLWTVF